MRPLTWAFVIALIVGLAGCGIPKDPEGTLDRVERTGALRAAASPAEGRVAIDGEQVTGVEPTYVEGFAESLGAEVEWHVMGEEGAVDALERGEVDVLVGGLTADNPHGAKLSLTRPYATTVEHGETVEHVMAVRMGENAMLSELERYLDQEAP